MAAAIRPEQLPSGVQIADLALARERMISTDLGVGAAIPHARCPGLAAPVIVFGLSHDGIHFTPQSTEPVRLVFLLVTPLEEPDQQLFLLARIARVAGNRSIQNRLIHATSASEVVDLISQDELASDTFTSSQTDA
jgi:mannitol/fructose-specific phosphotransferase system IIA component (Ntr-type)